MSDIGSMYDLLGRKPKATEKLISLAPRSSTLKGKTVALYHNDKVASFPVMATIKKLLEPLGVKEIFEVHARTPFSRHPDSAIDEALKADVVFAGTGDWGSCTGWVTDAAVRIEKGGKPTVMVVATAFKNEFIIRSNLHGMPYLPFVIVDYDQEFLPIIPQQVEKVFNKLVKGLITAAEELEKHIPGEVI